MLGLLLHGKLPLHLALRAVGAAIVPVDFANLAVLARGLAAALSVNLQDITESQQLLIDIPPAFQQFLDELFFRLRIGIKCF